MASLAANMLGVGAAICSMLSFAPQAYKIIRERNASSVSLHMYIVTITGFSLWIAYGVMLKTWPLVGSNTVCLALATLILGLKLRYGGRARTAFEMRDEITASGPASNLTESESR